MKNVYVITGGSGGIGLESAKELKDGVVFIADIAKHALEQGRLTLLDLGIDVHTALCDVTKKEEVEDLAKSAKAFGKIKGIAHTAGVSGSVKDAKVVMNVDLIGTANIIEAFYPYVEEGSSMVLISSMMGYVIPPNPEYDCLMKNCHCDEFFDKIIPFCQNNSDTAYNFAKRGVQLLVEEWAAKYGEKGARINSVSPGIIETEMAKKAAEEHPEQMQYMSSITPLKRNGRPEEIASVISFLFSDKASFITGTDIRVDGGLIKNLISLTKK